MSAAKIPEPIIYQSLSQALMEIAGTGRITDRSPLTGGDINRAWKITITGGNRFFLKENLRENLSFFTSEFEALKVMCQVGMNFIQEPLALGTEGDRSFLILPYLTGPNPGRENWLLFGRHLARFHRAGQAEKFGFNRDNFIGSTPQVNSWREGWVDFFRENRIEHQIQLAAHYIDGSLSRKFIRFLDKLENYLPEPEYPSLLHGDLWSGNVLAGDEGALWMIDPAAYYGHREADMAMTNLFGGFPDSFYAAYGEEFPLDPEFPERKDLYNLYHLLNHLNMFGPSYMGAVRGIVERFS